MVTAADIQLYIKQIFTLMWGLDYSMTLVVHINKLLFPPPQHFTTAYGLLCSPGSVMHCTRDCNAYRERFKHACDRYEATVHGGGQGIKKHDLNFQSQVQHVIQTIGEEAQRHHWEMVNCPGCRAHPKTIQLFLVVWVLLDALLNYSRRVNWPALNSKKNGSRWECHHSCWYKMLVPAGTVQDSLDSDGLWLQLSPIVQSIQEPNTTTWF